MDHSLASEIAKCIIAAWALAVLAQLFGHIAQHTLDIAAYTFVLLAAVSSYGIAGSDTLARTLGAILRKAGVPDLDSHAAGESGDGEPAPRIVVLGFFTTASSLVTEIERSQPALLAELAVIDFNPVVIQRLRQRGIKVIYGDISKRETLLHAGVGRAEVLVCTLPDAILKGTTNVVHVRQLREINPTARIIVTGDSFAQIDELYQAGADYVRVPRITEATELCAMLAHALGNDLGPRRVEMEARLADRNEVLP